MLISSCCLSENVQYLVPIHSVKVQLEPGNQIYLLFIYLSKVYDNVSIAKLWNVLTEMNIEQNIIREIQELYRYSKANVKIGQRVSKSFI